MAKNQIDLTQKHGVVFFVNDVKQVAGFGLHVSPDAQADGYGGAQAELHFLAGSVGKPGAKLVLVCYDGYLDANRAQNEYRVDLGPKEDIENITVTVEPASVLVEAVRVSRNKYTDERYTYSVVSKFPIREESGFFRTGTLYWNENGVLRGRPQRKGSGYSVTEPYAWVGSLNVWRNVTDGLSKNNGPG